MLAILLTTTIVTMQAKVRPLMLIEITIKALFIQTNRVIKIREYLVVNIGKKLVEVNSEKDLTDKSLRTPVILMKETHEKFAKTNIKTQTTTKGIEERSRPIIIRGHHRHIQAKK